ncbi:MAG TPA: hypothetical protein VGF71_18355 [Caulobacteraceae bacterium]
MGPTQPRARGPSRRARALSSSWTGDLWHNSGANITVDEERALLFGYYSRAIPRPQANWNAVLSPRLQDELDPDFRRLLGLLAADLGGHRRGQ